MLCTTSQPSRWPGPGPGELLHTVTVANHDVYNSISSYHDVKLSDPIPRDNHLPGPTRLGDGDWLLESLAAARRGLTRSDSDGAGGPPGNLPRADAIPFFTAGGLAASEGL